MRYASKIPERGSLLRAAPPVLVTGANGLVGRAVVARLLATHPSLRIHALVRRTGAWNTLCYQLGAQAHRVSPVFGDITRAGLGTDARTLARLGAVRVIVHCAADNMFSRPLADARRVNTAGTGQLLELGDLWGVERFVHVSTAFVAGRRMGRIAAAPADGGSGFVNGYERSKQEAELLVRSSARPWVILRPSTIACDDVDGAVTQRNAVHRALRVCHGGLAALLPGREDTPVDVVTTRYVADAVVRLGFAAGTERETYHLCAGSGALPLGELLDRSYELWRQDASWRARGIAQPALADLATYRMFEQSVCELGDARLTAITRSLSYFAPQLALPKQFDTTSTDAALGAAAPEVRSYWMALLRHLLATRWGALERAA